MLPTIADVFQCAVKWQATDGQTAANVLYFRSPAGDPNSIVGAMEVNVVADMFHTMSSAAIAETCVVTPLDGVSGPLPIPLEGWVGTEPGDYIPAGACVLTLYTAVGGRSNRGRIYLPFASEGAQVNGHWIGDADSVVAPAWNTFAASMASDGHTLCVASLITEHTDHGAPAGASVPHSNDVVNIVQQHFLGTQRRRQSRLRSV